MSEELKPEEWAAQLRLFLIRHGQEGRLADRRQLSAIEEWQCRVSGGALLKFLRFLTRPEYRGDHPELEEVARAGKRLVCVTDAVGALAAHDILRMFRPQAVWVFEDVWREWLEDRSWADPGFDRHIEYLSGWRPAHGADKSGDYWLHSEEYRLAAATGRAFEHLWRWADEELELISSDPVEPETS